MQLLDLLFNRLQFGADFFHGGGGALRLTPTIPEIPMDRSDDYGPLSDSRRYSLDRARPHITYSKDSSHRRFERTAMLRSRRSSDKAARVQSHAVGQPLCTWVSTYHHEKMFGCEAAFFS